MIAGSSHLKKRQKISDRLPLNREKIAPLLARWFYLLARMGVCVDFILPSFPDWHAARRTKKSDLEAAIPPCPC